jgi:glyoxylase-like metal-dependent hydrolase (beta-lactamase superfamily II)
MKMGSAMLVLAAALPANAQRSPMLRALTEKRPEIVKVGGIEIVHVQKNIYMLVGGGANVTVQIGEQGAFLVDAGSAGQGDHIVAAVRHLTSEPLRVLVNTAADADLVGGDAAIVAAAGGLTGPVADAQGRPGNTGILTIAHDNTLHWMTTGSASLPPLSGDALPLQAFISERKDLYFNGEAVQILHQPHARTDGDAIVFFRGSDVISTGDLFRTDSYPVIDPARGGSIQGEIDALNVVLDLTVPERNQMGGTRVVPGHGWICNEADVLEYRDMLTIIRDRVADMLKEHWTLEQVKAAKPTLEYDPIYGGNEEMTANNLLGVIYHDLSQKK